MSITTATRAKKGAHTDTGLIEAHVKTARIITAETLVGLMEAKIMKWFERTETAFSCRHCPRKYVWTSNMGKPWTTLLNHISQHEKELEPSDEATPGGSYSPAA